MIEIEHLTKDYGRRRAVDDLTFSVRSGAVTGFLGPNGAGKSTTLRSILGLTRPTGGQALVGGRPYTDHERPLRLVGALLDAGAAHPGRTAYHHLRALAATHGISKNRVISILEEVGLEAVARKRVGTYSLGMRQRLGVAGALLADPEVLVLDEPVNGLDPDGIRWIRGLTRGLAAEGRTVFVSSHLMSEMALTADHLIIIGRGRLLADVSMAELTAAATPTVRVRTPHARDLAALLQGRPDVEVVGEGEDVLLITGLSQVEVTETAFANRIVLHDVTSVSASLEDAYMALVADHVEHHAKNTERTPA